MPRRHRLPALDHAPSELSSVTAAPHDFPDQLGSQPPDGAGESVAPEELAKRFLNEATESDFPERLASEEHDRERELVTFASDEPDAWELEDVERLLSNAPTLARLIQDVWQQGRSARLR